MGAIHRERNIAIRKTTGRKPRTRRQSSAPGLLSRPKVRPPLASETENPLATRSVTRDGARIGGIQSGVLRMSRDKGYSLNFLGEKFCTRSNTKWRPSRARFTPEYFEGVWSRISQSDFSLALNFRSFRATDFAPGSFKSPLTISTRTEEKILMYE